MKASVTFARRHRPPGVLLVAETGASGGIGRYCLDVAEMLGETAAIACLCTVSDREGETCWLARQCRERNVRLHAVPMGARQWKQACSGLAALWRETGQPLVHTNGRRGNFIAQALAGLLPGFSFITTVHGLLGLHRRRNLFYRLVDLGACQRASAVIAVCADSHRRLLAAGSPPVRTFCIPNGLRAKDSAALGHLAQSRAATSSFGRGTRVGFLGRLSREKGIEDFVRIANRLHSVESKVEFVVAGDGPLKPLLAREASGLMSTGVLRCVGEMQDVGKMLGDVDVLIMPSRNEGMPYVLLEGMAAGCAVAGYGVGGIPEVVSDRSLGILARPEDVNGLFEGVLRLVRQPELASRVGSHASRHVMCRFALESRLDSLLSAYDLGGFYRTRQPNIGTPPNVNVQKGWLGQCG